MKAVIMAGGKGTRLRGLTGDTPKPMVRIGNKPVLEYQIESLKENHVVEIILVVSHLSNAIQDYFGDGKQWGVSIEYLIEEFPLGTAGALYYLKDKIYGDFFLIFGDLMLDINWIEFMRYHCNKQATVTLFAHPNSHPYDSDILLIDQNNYVLSMLYKNKERTFYYKNIVNAGIYCVNSDVFSLIARLEKQDFEKNVVCTLLDSRGVCAYISSEYVKDIGTPDRLAIVTKDVQDGLVKQRNLKNKQKCVFLDRDGTINELNGFVKNTEQFNLLPNVATAIRQLNRSQYLTIVATNQPVIARGECSFDQLEKIHMKMETLLGEKHAFVDDIYFCPHHTDKGFDGEVLELKIECDCRKPKIGMFLDAAKKHNIELKDSWYIGDTSVDVQTGVNAGMRTILLLTGAAGLDDKYDVKADYIAIDLLDAVLKILTFDSGGENDGLHK